MTSRRHLLRGAAGFTLALPFLASLGAKKDAAAGAPPYAANPRFVAMTTQHGGVWGANMWPEDAVLGESRTIYPGHVARHGLLAPQIAGDRAALSPVLRADASLLTSSLAAKMNLLRGLDIPHYIGHHTGGELGNFASLDDTLHPPPVDERRPTIDQVMAESPSFYPDLSGIRQRSLHVGTHRYHAWARANPADPSSAVQAVPLSQSAQALFDLVFVPPEVEENPRPLVVDRVIEHYDRLRHGAFGDARRLSARDAQRLDDHMDRLRDLQTRLHAHADCSQVTPLASDTAGLQVGGYATDLADIARYYQLYNDVIVAAFLCGTSRVAVINSGETWSTEYPGLCCDWHDLVVHATMEGDSAREVLVVEAQQRFFESVFLDLVGKLDVEESDGITVLDNSLVMWAQESGTVTHFGDALPIVTAGSAAGYFETGRYVDYRNRDNLALSDNRTPEHQARRPGLPYQRFLGNVLLSMGLAPEEFEYPGEKGYGDNYVDDEERMPAQYMDDASEPLPIIAS
jgi:hypothetical protein